MNRAMKRSALALLLLATACSSPDGGRATRSEATGSVSAKLEQPYLPWLRAEVLAADARAANETTMRGADGLLAQLADDAILLLHKEPAIYGKKAIADYLAANPLAGTLTWRYARGDSSALGDLGYSFGWTELIHPADAIGAVAVDYGQYTAVWKRDDQRRWKLAVFSRSDLARAPAAPPSDMVPITGDGPVYPKWQSPDASRDELMELDKDFSAYTVQVGNQKGFDAYVAETAVQTADPWRYGRASIFAYNAAPPGGPVLSWIPVTAAASASGDLGYTVGTYTYVFPSGATYYGKYVTVWQRQADGQWKWIVDGGSSNPRPQ